MYGVCVCVCVCVREREREGRMVFVRACVWCVCVYCVCEQMRAKGIESMGTCDGRSAALVCMHVMC